MSQNVTLRYKGYVPSTNSKKYFKNIEKLSILKASPPVNMCSHITA
jgi:hypothetical protein